MTCQEMVSEFHKVFGLPHRKKPYLPRRKERNLRIDLIDEEFQELIDALDGAGDVVEVADALADLAYVVYGAALTFGIDLDAVITEVHRSNMLKRFPDGTVRHRADGKVLKPESWKAPDIAGVLGVE